jgi:hypothetical protein
MKANVLWNLMTLGIFILALVLQGCTVDNDDVIVIDDTPPAAPRGVYTVTGDEQVLIEWYPNQEADLKGYIVYRSLREREGYAEIAEVGSEVASYVDDDVENGITYYYAVSAFDFDDNESNLSPEAYDRSGVDIYFGVDTQVMVPYIFSDNETDMQDLGYTDSMDDVDVSPTRGFTTLFVEAIIGHTYAFLTPDGNYAKIRVTDMYIDWVNGDVGEAWAIFDWAYQLQLDNPELAPGRNY